MKAKMLTAERRKKNPLICMGEEIMMGITCPNTNILIQYINVDRAIVMPSNEIH